MSCPDLILHKWDSSHPGASFFSTPVLPSLMELSLYKQITYTCCVVLCVTRYSLGLCDMNCYSVNGSHTSQGGIPLGGMSQIKTEHFRLPWHLHLPPRSSYISTPFWLNVILCWAPNSLHPERWVTGLRGLCLLPFPNMGITGCCEHEGAVPAFDWWTVSELIRNKPNNSSNIDKPGMKLSAETWRNMVGGGTVSGLRSMLWKWSLEVLLLLLLSRFSCVQLCATP